MANFFYKVLLLLLVATAAAAHKPHSPRGLRATPHTPPKKKRLNPTRSLENHAKFNNKIANKHQAPFKHNPKPPHRHLQLGDPANIECEAAASLELDEIAQVDIDVENFNSFWFSIIGTGGIFAVSTCPDGVPPSADLEAYFDVYSGSSCNNLELEDYGGSYFDFCEVAYMETSANEVIHINAYGFTWEETPGATFSLTVYEVDEIPNTHCEGATLVELGETVEGEISQTYGSTWFTFVGTGNDLVISTCTGNTQLDNAAFDSVINVSARDCDDLRWIASDDEGGKCGNGKSALILSSVEGLMYHIEVYEYAGMTGPFGLKVSASA